jgi:hypothetical protein
MMHVYKIAVWVLGLTALVAASPLIACVSTAIPVNDIILVTTTVFVTNTIFATSAVPIKDVSIATTTYSNGNDLTIAITNSYETPLYLSFGSNAGAPSPVGNPQATVLPEASTTQYAFPTGWAGRIYVGPNLNPDGSKIEGSFILPNQSTKAIGDIDVSYVDGYTVPIQCFSDGVAVSGCKTDLFKQPGITCDNQVDGPVCLNSAQNIPHGPAPPFFAACAGAAYTYPYDDHANKFNLGSNLVSCCIGASCQAPSTAAT